jgi:hypothetical protein
MSERIATVLDQIEDQQQEPLLPEGVTALPLLQMAYCGQVKLTQQQLRAAIEALPFEAPKLSATAIASLDGDTFAEALQRCLERSAQSVPLLNGPTEPLPAAEMKKPFTKYRRF